MDLVDLKQKLLPVDEVVSWPCVATVPRLWHCPIEAVMDEAADVALADVIHAALHDAADCWLEDDVVGLHIKVEVWLVIKDVTVAVQ